MLKTTRSPNKLVSNRNNNNKSAFNKNNNNKPAFGKNNNNGKVDKFGINEKSIEYAESGKLSKSRKSKSKKMSKF